MKRSHVWIGAGIFFVGLVGSGFVPDLRFAADFREAEAMGLTASARKPPVAVSDDAAPIFRMAATRFAPIPTQLVGDYAGTVKLPTSQLKKYLAVMQIAGEKPGCSALEIGRDIETANSARLNIFNAARASIDLAKEGSELEAAARLAKHLAGQNTALSAGRWAYLVDAAFAKATHLGLSAEARSAMRTAFRDRVDLRELLKNHVAQTVEEMERDSKENGRRLCVMKEESAYLRFWIGFFKEHPAGTDLVAAIDRAGAIDEVEERAGQFSQLSGIAGTTTHPWAAWAQKIQKANDRLAAG